MVDYVADFNDLESKNKFFDFIKSLDGEYIIKFKRRKKGRSVQENKYYWSIIIGYISDYTGHHPLYLHEYYKYKFIPCVKFTDESRLSTADMTHDEIWDYINWIREDAKTTLGLNLPDPDGVIL